MSQITILDAGNRLTESPNLENSPNNFDFLTHIRTLIMPMSKKEKSWRGLRVRM